MPWILGIDTSAYTTSVAAVDLYGKLLGEERQLLSVTAGKRGMRQSEAVFNHVRNLPLIIEKLAGKIVNGGNLALVASSVKPRPAEGSYMPVFLVGQGMGRCIAASAGISFYPTTHQEGHLEAGIMSSDGPISERFLAVHLSGGTTEILMVKKRPAGYDIETLGKSLDLHAGQLVDRVGVALGLPFPAGSHLEELARHSDDEFPRLPSSVDGFNFSFSGAESQAQRWIAEGLGRGRIARSVESCLANTLEKVIRRAVKEKGTGEVLIVGGVASNQHLRQRLSQRLEHPAVGARTYFAEPALSSDNAVGVARLGWKRYNQEQFQEVRK